MESVEKFTLARRLSQGGIYYNENFGVTLKYANMLRYPPLKRTSSKDPKHKPSFDVNIEKSKI